jgi:hypothetical protein
MKTYGHLRTDWRRDWPRQILGLPANLYGNLRVSASFGKRAMIPAAELERFVNTLGNYEVRNIGRRAHKKTLVR